MRFTLHVEQIDDPDGDGLIWEASISEFPDLRGYDYDPVDAACVAVDAAITLTLNHRPSVTTEGAA